ncbi:hypothetical protein [Pseudarthrobacter sulfonivorans]|uniref:hypothetical protein n=1 Tax=Pseudarthrobacter sulfonivorans TaxID=121292 RepID=UPI00285D4EB7|nr:hypothetical protein [Pseudarthrobacter sulfonivorans]MDR6413482.1 hypothetical protein [Pseudarthrobacter sulfonivorans]
MKTTALACEDKTLLGIAPSESARDDQIAAMSIYTEKLGYRILGGKNWVISGKSIETVRQKLGGIVAG